MLPTESGSKAWRAFLEAHASISKRLERELRTECDLPLSWYDALVQLHEAGGSLRMHQLAERLLLSRSATTRFADRLATAGLIERRSVSADKRGTEVSLTSAGLDELKRTAPVHMRGVVEHFTNRFDEDELEAIRSLFGRLAPDACEQ